MVLEIAKNYSALLRVLPLLIDVSGYRNDYLRKKWG